MDERKRSHRLLGVSNQRASHIRLVKGVVLRNSPLQVLCPTLAKGIGCSRGAGSRRFREPYRPKLLVKNHGDPGLQLWFCEGCSHFLLRVKF